MESAEADFCHHVVLATLMMAHLPACTDFPTFQLESFSRGRSEWFKCSTQAIVQCDAHLTHPAHHYITKCTFTTSLYCLLAHFLSTESHTTTMRSDLDCLALILKIYWIMVSGLVHPGINLEELFFDITGGYQIPQSIRLYPVSRTESVASSSTY